MAKRRGKRGYMGGAGVNLDVRQRSHDGHPHRRHFPGGTDFPWPIFWYVNQNGWNCKPNPHSLPDTSQWLLSLLLVASHFSFFLWLLIFQTSSWDFVPIQIFIKNLILNWSSTHKRANLIISRYRQKPLWVNNTWEGKFTLIKDTCVPTIEIDGHSSYKSTWAY